MTDTRFSTEVMVAAGRKGLRLSRSVSPQEDSSDPKRNSVHTCVLAPAICRIKIGKKNML